MFSFLKYHPFAVEAVFDSSLVLTFAVPKEELVRLIPEVFELDIFDNKYGFVAVAMVQTKGLRPKGFPTIMGNDFFLIGYRIFVRYTDKRGKRLRGLYIIKSETDKKKMELLGNVFTHYNYTTTDIQQQREEGRLMISSYKSAFNVSVNMNTEGAVLPSGSPFANWKEARRFAGPLPFTFTYLKDKNEVLIIEGVRTDWQPTAIDISDYYFEYLNTLELKGIKLASAFEIKNVPYYWKKGKVEYLL